jgi:hypothetical protein
MSIPSSDTLDALSYARQSNKYGQESAYTQAQMNRAQNAALQNMALRVSPQQWLVNKDSPVLKEVSKKYLNRKLLLL